jgi:hypothetical protein
LKKPADPQQAITIAVHKIAGFKDVKMNLSVNIETGGQFNDQIGVLSEIASPVLVDIKFSESEASGPYEEIENPITGATCMIDGAGQLQSFHGRPHPSYAEPLVYGFKAVHAWYYVTDTQDYWHVQGELPGIPFPGRTYSSSTADVYISNKTGMFAEIITTQVYTENGGPRIIFTGTQGRFMFNTGVHIRACT